MASRSLTFMLVGECDRFCCHVLRGRRSFILEPALDERARAKCGDEPANGVKEEKIEAEDTRATSLFAMIEQ